MKQTFIRKLMCFCLTLMVALNFFPFTLTTPLYAAEANPSEPKIAYFFGQKYAIIWRSSDGSWTGDGEPGKTKTFIKLV